MERLTHAAGRAFALLLALAFVACSAKSDFAKQVSKDPTDWGKLLAIASKLKPAEVDKLAIDGQPFLGRAIANAAYRDEVDGLVVKGADIVFSGGSKFYLLDQLIVDDQTVNYPQNLDYAAELIRLKTGKSDALGYLGYFKKIGYGYRESNGRLADFFFRLDDQKAIDALVAEQGYNDRFIRRASARGDIEALARIFDSGYAVQYDDIVAAADSGNILAFRAVMERAKDVNADAVLSKSRDHITRDSLLMLFPRVSDEFDVDEYIVSMINDGKYDCAAYLLNYGRLIHEADEGSFTTVSGYLGEKAFRGSTRAYSENDLSLPNDIAAALGKIGLSPYLLLRNEIFARHGYIPTNPVLSKILNGVSWYSPKPDVTAADLNDVERRNVQYVRARETPHDEEVVARWLDEKAYTADERFLNKEEDYRLPNEVVISLGSLGINPAALLRSEIYARHGSVLPDGKLQGLFEKTAWYKSDGSTWDVQKLREASVKEAANVLLLQCREWIEILDSNRQTLPDAVKAVPVVGYNTLFLKTVTVGDVTFALSSPSMSFIVAAGPQLFEGKQIGPAADQPDLSQADIDKISQTEDPIEALKIYFEKKTYKGTLDAYLLRPLDMQPPLYLADAVSKLRVNWTTILRKEIHARHGAIFSPDTLSGKIFTTMSWYKPKYNLVDSTPSRLPAIAGVNETEALNFLIMEGQDLIQLRDGQSDNGISAFDLGGNAYAIRIKPVEINVNDGTGAGKCFMGYGFGQGEDSESLDQTINDMIKELIPPVQESYYEEGRCG